MNNVMLLGVIALSVSLMAGCGKKEEEVSLDNNAVISENVVSITDPAALTDPNAVPVVVENAVAPAAEAMLGDSSSATGIVSDKPTPKNIQTALKNAGLYSGKIDGNIGPKSKQAVEAFQSQNGLKADGKVGPKTWKALSAYLNKPSEVINPTDTIQTEQ